MHGCIQEKSLERLERAIDKLYVVIEGNGSDGLTTKVALLIKAMDDIPPPGKLKAYAFFGGGSVAFLCFVGIVVVKLFA